MNCKIARQKILDRLDCEIDAEANRLTAGGLQSIASPGNDVELDKHLAECAVCRREFRLFIFPRTAVATEPPVTASAWFYQRLCLRIEDESKSRAGRQAVWKLAFRMIPALAGITLLLASIFVWQEVRPSTAPPRNYEYVFITDDAARRMLADDQNDITYENILAALAERRTDDLSDGK